MLPWLFEAARPETTFCASYACPDLRKLISDTVSVAGGSMMSMQYHQGFPRKAILHLVDQSMTFGG
jgi:hypothetical protein